MDVINRLIKNTGNIVMKTVVFIGAAILVVAVDFAIFTLAYGLITIILGAFFNFVLPFSWWYSLGAWLITLVAVSLTLPGSFVKGLLSKE